MQKPETKQSEQPSDDRLYSSVTPAIKAKVRKSLRGWKTKLNSVFIWCLIAQHLSLIWLIHQQSIISHSSSLTAINQYQTISPLKLHKTYNHLFFILIKTQSWWKTSFHHQPSNIWSFWDKRLDSASFIIVISPSLSPPTASEEQQWLAAITTNSIDNTASLLKLSPENLIRDSWRVLLFLHDAFLVCFTPQTQEFLL